MTSVAMPDHSHLSGTTQRPPQSQANNSFNPHSTSNPSTQTTIPQPITRHPTRPESPSLLPTHTSTSPECSAWATSPPILRTLYITRTKTINNSERHAAVLRRASCLHRAYGRTYTFATPQEQAAMPWPLGARGRVRGEWEGKPRGYKFVGPRGVSVPEGWVRWIRVRSGLGWRVWTVEEMEGEQDEDDEEGLLGMTEAEAEGYYGPMSGYMGCVSDSDDENSHCEAEDEDNGKGETEEVDAASNVPDGNHFEDEEDN